jgi:hypothetical protein
VNLVLFQGNSVFPSAEESTVKKLSNATYVYLLHVPSFLTTNYNRKSIEPSEKPKPMLYLEVKA